MKRCPAQYQKKKKKKLVFNSLVLHRGITSACFVTHVLLGMPTGLLLFVTSNLSGHVFVKHLVQEGETVRRPTSALVTL